METTAKLYSLITATLRRTCSPCYLLQEILHFPSFAI